MKKYYLILIFCFFCSKIWANQNIVDEQLYYAFLKEVKCVTCQNQSVADSYAPMALTMRKEIRHQFEQGKSGIEIKEMLVERYGESVFFAPKINSKHLFVWLMPIVILILGGIGFKRLLK